MTQIAPTSFAEADSHIVGNRCRTDRCRSIYQKKGEVPVVTLNAHHPDTKWPREVDMILSALEAAGHDSPDRRGAGRSCYRVFARLHLFSDGDFASPWKLFTRDANSRGLGFLTPHRLPLGYGGRVELPAPDGSILSVHCTLLRCCEAAPGWYEGALYFNREQIAFAPRHHV
jgi:hypothetical protein